MISPTDPTDSSTNMIASPKPILHTKDPIIQEACSNKMEMQESNKTLLKEPECSYPGAAYKP